jgi:excisionase family DNA binding protein
MKGAHRATALPNGAPLVDSRRLEPLLAKRVSELTMRVEQGDADCWRPLCEALLAYQALQTIGSPERQGRPLSTAEMAQRLGVKPKSLRRMVQQQRIRPAVKVGRLMRWSGQEAAERG